MRIWAWYIRGSGIRWTLSQLQRPAESRGKLFLRFSKNQFSQGSPLGNFFKYGHFGLILKRNFPKFLIFFKKKVAEYGFLMHFYSKLDSVEKRAKKYIIWVERCFVRVLELSDHCAHTPQKFENCLRPIF